MTINIFADDFEGGLLSSKWQCIGAACSVQSDVVHNGDYALKILSGGGSDPTIDSVTIGKNHKLKFDFYFRVATPSGNYEFDLLTLFLTDKTNYIVPMSVSYSGGTPSLRYRTGTGSYVEYATYSHDTWYHMECIVDFDAGFMSWSVDGTSKGSVVLTASSSYRVLPTDSLRDFLFAASSMSTPTVYFDVLTVSQESAYFIDCFESGGLSNWDTVGSKWSVQGSEIHNGTYAAMHTASSGTHYLIKSFDNIKSKKLTFDFYLYCTSLIGTEYLCSIYEASDGWAVNALSISSGHLKYQTDGSLQNLPTDVTITTTTWMHFIIILDFEANTLSWVVDGISKGSVALKDNGGNAWGIDTQIYELDLIAGSSGMNLYLDDYYIYRDAYVNLAAKYPLKPMQGILV